MKDGEIAVVAGRVIVIHPSYTHHGSEGTFLLLEQTGVSNCKSLARQCGQRIDLCCPECGYQHRKAAEQQDSDGNENVVWQTSGRDPKQKMIEKGHGRD